MHRVPAFRKNSHKEEDSGWAVAENMRREWGAQIFSCVFGSKKNPKKLLYRLKNSVSKWFSSPQELWTRDMGENTKVAKGVAKSRLCKL